MFPCPVFDRHSLENVYNKHVLYINSALAVVPVFGGCETIQENANGSAAAAAATLYYNIIYSL